MEKIAKFLCKEMIKYSNKHYKNKDKEWFYPLYTRLLPFYIGFIFFLGFLDDYLVIFNIIQLLMLVTPLLFILLFTLKSIVDDETIEDGFWFSYSNKSFVLLLLENIDNEYLKDLILKKAINSNYRLKKAVDFLKDGTDIQYQKSGAYFKDKNGEQEYISSEHIDIYKSFVSFFERNGIKISVDKYVIMSDLEYLKKIKKEKKKIVLKERELRAKIFANKESRKIMLDEYAKEIMEKNDVSELTPEEQKAYQVFEIENE